VTIPRLTRHLQPRRNWPALDSSVLITHPITRSGAVGLPPVPWTEKNNSKFGTLRPNRRSLLRRRLGWTDKLVNFF
jgi:hypothetical protein